MVLAAALTLAACAREPFGVKTGRNSLETVKFTVGLREVLTKADRPETTTMDDASGTFQLYVAVFNKADGALSAASRIGGDGFEPVSTLDGARGGELTLSLSTKLEYKVVFFAQRADAYDVRFADEGVATFSYKNGLRANNADLDAFWASVDVSASNLSYEVQLRRPFAQLNVFVPADNVPSGQTTFRSSMTVKAPATFDLYAGVAAGDAATVTFAENAISAGPFGKYASAQKPYRWVGMNYVLVPESGVVEIASFQESGMSGAVNPGMMPVRVNCRTNLVGMLYGSDLDFTCGIAIDAGFEVEPGKEPLLQKSAVGCYLEGTDRPYVAGTDQFVREYDGNALTFVLLDPAAEEQLAVSGYADTMSAGDAFDATVLWKKAGVEVLSNTSRMSVLKEEDGLVWLANQKGYGFVIKK